MSRVTEAGMDGAREDWSARRKEGVVMRLLRGESLDLLARESAQPAGRISAWREEFLAGGREGLKSRPAPVEDRRLAEAQRMRSMATRTLKCPPSELSRQASQGPADRLRDQTQSPPRVPIDRKSV